MYNCTLNSDIETKLLKADEVFGKFPKMFNHVSDDTKSKLLKFLETKVCLIFFVCPHIQLVADIKCLKFNICLS